MEAPKFYTISALLLATIVGYTQATERLVDPQDCSKYYQYVSPNLFERKHCRAGQFFDVSAERCESISDPETCTAAEFQCPDRAGRIRYSSDCQMYTCLDGELQTPEHCPPGTYYEPYYFVCSPAQIQSDCGQYTACVDGWATELSCPDDQVYDPHTGLCADVFAPTMCTDRRDNPSLNCTGVFGNAPVIGDCTSYYICDDGFPKRYPCASNGYFDAEIGSCVSGDPAGC